MTLQQVADAIGSHKGHLSRIENGNVALTAETATLIADLFGIGVDTLRNRAPDAAMDAEQDLLALFRSLSDKGKRAALASVRAITEMDEQG